MQSLNHRKAALSLNFLLIGANVLALTLLYHFTDNCYFETCEVAFPGLFAWLFLSTQLICLSTAWFARTLGRNGLEWLAYVCLAIALSINVLFIAIGRGYQSVSEYSIMLLLVIPPLQFLWLLARCWRQIGVPDQTSPRRLPAR